MSDIKPGPGSLLGGEPGMHPYKLFPSVLLYLVAVIQCTVGKLGHYSIWTESREDSQLCLQFYLPPSPARHSCQVLLFKDKFIGGEKSSFYFPFRGNCDLNYLVDSLYYCSLLEFTKIAPNQEFIWLDIWYSRVVKVTEVDKIKWQYLAIWCHSLNEIRRFILESDSWQIGIVFRV